MEEKGRDLPKPTSADNPARRGSSQNISQRLVDSASGLLRVAVSTSRDDSAITLSHTLASQGKAGPSISAPPQSGVLDERVGSINVRQSPGAVPDSNESFRESSSAHGNTNLRPADIANGMSLDEFMHSAQYENDVPNWQHGATAKGKQKALSSDECHAEHEAADSALATVWDSPVNNRLREPDTNGTQKAAEINEADGADVVKLLRNPNFSTLTDEPEYEEEEMPYTITEDDLRIAELLRGIDIDSASNSSHTSAILAAKRGEPFKNFSSFFDEVENYQDEVWGYLRPLVEKAKKERTMPNSSGSDDGPATRRLRMILAHIDGSR